MVAYESICYWCVKFGALYSKNIKKRSIMVMMFILMRFFCNINGKFVYLWHAVDQNGQTIDVLVQEKRDRKAAQRFI
ncbi:DDE-type integrase/transposase/recombinase [Orbus mooreae]|uniref:DDE-type integrase/transposase/recombinase n=1 Tax=Orbus mooreae TaxID=3074107 RepID=UPI00370D8CE7